MGSFRLAAGTLHLHKNAYAQAARHASANFEVVDNIGRRGYNIQQQE